jgi:hypothetical protein
LVKKTNRQINKKLCVKYASRSKTAVGRIRHKGMFLNIPKALLILGLPSDAGLSAEAIQLLLNNRSEKPIFTTVRTVV